MLVGVDKQVEAGVRLRSPIIIPVDPILGIASKLELILIHNSIKIRYLRWLKLKGARFMV